MCEAIEGIRNDAKAEGVEEGILKTLIVGNEDNPRQFRPHPMSHPEGKRR